MNACAQQATVMTGWLVPSATIPASAQITAKVSHNDCQWGRGSGISFTLPAARGGGKGEPL